MPQNTSVFKPSSNGQQHDAPATPPPPAPKPVARCLAYVQAEDVHWLWQDHIPRKAITLLDGDPGSGKSTLALDIAARVTRGQRMPPDVGDDPGANPVVRGVLVL